MTNLSNLGATLSSMIGTIAVIDLVAILMQGAHENSRKAGDKAQWHHFVNLGILGGLFGIYATLSGRATASGAVISMRDIGPMMAGCLSGPVGGLIAGTIAGVHRLLYGLPDVTAGSTIPCAISTLFIGVICGLGSAHFQNRRIHRPLWAMLIAAVMEVFHLTIVFFYLWGRSGLQASINVIIDVAPGFIIANGAGFGLLIYVMDMIERYKKAESHAQQIESELDVANSIQEDMLPAIFPNFPGRKEFILDAAMNPAKEVGGDFYDFFFIDDDHFAFLIADVSGKGIPAALFMVISKTVIKNNVQSGMSPAEAMTKANKQLCEGNEANMFVTAWLGVLEFSTGRLTYVNAGHNPPIIHRSGLPATFIRDLSGFILAGSPRSKYKQFETWLSDGDKIFLYTDGVTEAMNGGNEQYGEERLMSCLASANPNTSATGIIDYVKNDIHNYIGDTPQSDDITMLALRISGEYRFIKVEPTMEQFERLSAFMEQQLTAGGVPATLLGKMNVVLDELYSNVVKYSGSIDFVLGVSTYPGHIGLQMSYGGTPFDITKAQTPDLSLSAKDRPIGGLGLLIVNKIMDKVMYRNEAGVHIIPLAKEYGTTEAAHD